MNRLTTGAAWLRRQLRSHASDYVTYRRGVSSVSLRATHSAQGGTVSRGSPIVSTATDDFIFDVAELVLGGVAVVPAPNDEIEDGDGVKYRVSQDHPDGCSRNIGGRVRVHTTRV